MDRGQIHSFSVAAIRELTRAEISDVSPHPGAVRVIALRPSSRREDRQLGLESFELPFALGPLTDLVVFGGSAS